MKKKYEIIIVSNGVIGREIINADYITVNEVGNTIFWFEEYGDHHTVVAVAPPSAIVIPVKS